MPKTILNFFVERVKRCSILWVSDCKQVFCKINLGLWKFSCGLKCLFSLVPSSYGSLAGSCFFKWWGRGAIWNVEIRVNFWNLEFWTWEERLLNLSDDQRDYLDCGDFVRSATGFWAELWMDFHGSMIHCIACCAATVCQLRYGVFFASMAWEIWLLQWMFLGTSHNYQLVKPSSFLTTLQNSEALGLKLPSWLCKSYLETKQVCWITCSLAVHQLLWLPPALEQVQQKKWGLAVKEMKLPSASWKKNFPEPQQLLGLKYLKMLKRWLPSKTKSTQDSFKSSRGQSGTCLTKTLCP